MPVKSTIEALSTRCPCILCPCIVATPIVCIEPMLQDLRGPTNGRRIPTTRTLSPDESRELADSTLRYLTLSRLGIQPCRQSSRFSAGPRTTSPNVARLGGALKQSLAGPLFAWIRQTCGSSWSVVILILDEPGGSRPARHSGGAHLWILLRGSAGSARRQPAKRTSRSPALACRVRMSAKIAAKSRLHLADSSSRICRTLATIGSSQFMSVFHQSFRSTNQ